MKPILSLLIISFGFFGKGHAQELSKAQKEVWETVKAYTEQSHQRNFEGYVSYFHPEFEGWHAGWKKPTDYAARTAGLKNFFASSESIMYNLELHSIRVFDNIAIVQYSNRIVSRSKKDETESFNVSKWTDILKKDNGKWKLIADHGD